MNWGKTIQEFAEREGVSLRQLAQRLGIGHVFVSEVARGAKPASPLLKLRLLRELGAPLDRDSLLLLLPDEVAAEVRVLDKSRK